MHSFRKNTGCSRQCFSAGTGRTFSAGYYGYNNKKQKLHSESDVNAGVQACGMRRFSVKSVKKTKKRVTGTAVHHLNTAAVCLRQLNMTPRRSMSIAQQLYEGVEIENEGMIGLSLYMRTDSLRLSEEMR